MQVSKKAIRRVKNPLPAPTECHYCTGHVELVTNDKIYNGRKYGDWLYAYLCQGCGAYVGVHPQTDIPLGTLADAELRQARAGGKTQFSALLQRGRFRSRAEAYQWLAEQICIPVGECHWGWFDLDRCAIARAVCLEELSRLDEKKRA